MLGAPYRRLGRENFSNTQKPTTWAQCGRGVVSQVENRFQATVAALLSHDFNGHMNEIE
jgi:hypothetical protein